MEGIEWKICKSCSWKDARVPIKGITPYPSKAAGVAAAEAMLLHDGADSVRIEEAITSIRYSYEPVELTVDSPFYAKRWVIPFKDGKQYNGPSLGLQSAGVYRSSVFQSETIASA